MKLTEIKKGLITEYKKWELKSRVTGYKTVLYNNIAEDTYKMLSDYIYSKYSENVADLVLDIICDTRKDCTKVIEILGNLNLRKAPKNWKNRKTFIDLLA